MKGLVRLSEDGLVALSSMRLNVIGNVEHEF